MSYITQGDLEALITPEAVLAIFNDQNTGAVNTSALTKLLNLASAQVDSYIARNYRGPFPIKPVPQTIKHATLLWARAFAYERHREYARVYQDGPRKEAHMACERLATANWLLPDHSAQPKPANVGGIVVDDTRRLMIPGPNGEDNQGDF